MRCRIAVLIYEAVGSCLPLGLGSFSLPLARLSDVDRGAEEIPEQRMKKAVEES